MRKLRKIKVMFSEKKGTSYHIAWKSSEDGDVWERHALESNDYPRPEFKQAISRMAFILVNACDIKMPDNEILSLVDITICSVLFCASQFMKKQTSVSSSWMQAAG